MATPNVSLSASQTSRGSKSIKCTYTLDSIETGASLEFYVRPPSGGYIHMSDYDGSASNGTFNKILNVSDIWTDYGNYTVRLWVYNNSTESDSDDAIVIMESNRPNDFSFPSSVRSGAATTTLTASKWNDFQNRINEFQTYKGVAQTNFDDVSSGDEMTASLMRKAWDAINSISGHGSMPTRPSSGSTIYASWFHDLADALNNIE